MSYKKKSDGNQAAIIKRLRENPEISVRSIHRHGDGIPDLLVGYRGRNYIFEVKNPEYDGRLTDAEQKFADGWKGQWASIFYVQEIIEEINDGD